MKLEVCAGSFESAIAAEQAGAHRIELCQELGIGGITPSHGLLKKVVEALNIPIFVLIRPRSGDFTYSESEFEVMLQNITYAKSLGVKGIVSGILSKDCNIDATRTKRLIKEAGGLSFTFHRAFDWTPDAGLALKTLIDLGVHRILTSGQAVTAVKGLGTLKALQKSSKNRIVIMPGGGISAENVALFKYEGFKEIHGSLSRCRASLQHPIAMYYKDDLNSNRICHTDIEKVKRLLDRINEKRCYRQ